MKKNIKHTRRVNRRKADARVLGQILAAQNIEFVLPDITRVAEFYAETLIAIPGIVACYVCLEDVTIQKGDMGFGFCGECQTTRRKAGGQKEPPVYSLDFRCALADQPGIQIHAIASLQHHFGFFVFQIGAPDAFNIYKPFIGNLANYVAISLENRLQRDFLQKARDELEYRVEERTNNLAVTNAHLQKEIEHGWQVEEALRESERQIKQLVDSSPVAMVVASGLEEKIEWINDKFIELFGYTIEDMPNAAHWWPLAYPDEAFREAIKTQWEIRVEQAIREKKQIEPMEATVRCKDGSLRHIEFRLSSIGLKHLITFVDLTDRKRAEDALAAREMELRNMAESSPGLMGTFYLRPDGSTCMPYTSPQIEHLFGLLPEDVVNDATPLLARTHSDDAQRVKESIAESARTMTPWRLEYRVIHPTRGELWLEGSTNPKPHSNGGVIWYGYVHDITPRKRAQEALLEHEKHSQSLLRLSRFLESAQTYAEVLNAARDEIKAIIGYQNLWAYLLTPDKKQAKALFAKGPMADIVMSEDGTSTLTIQGDRMMEEFLETKEIMVVEDAQIDERTDKEIVARMGNRTLVNVPILLFDRHLGSVGMGTFGDEGVRIPTASEREYLIALASHMAVTLDRVHLLNERKETEAQLLASEQLFRALVENSPDFIARYDRAFRRIYVNPAIQKLFKSSVDNVLGKTPADQSPVFAPQAYIAQLTQVIETATESDTEMPFRTAQGDMHWGHMRFVPEFGPDGKVDSVLAIGRDIHEIKENERRFRMLAENFPDFVIRFDRNGLYHYVNPVFEKALGMPVEAIIGKTLQELPQHNEMEQNELSLGLIRRAFDEGVSHESEARWITRMGERIFENRYIPEKDATGNVVAVLCIAHDITERKQAEEVLQRLNRELRAISNCNQLLLRAEDEQTLLDDICHIVCEEAGYHMAWVGYAEEEAKTVRLVAWAGRETRHLANAEITWADTERDPSGMALRSGQSASIQDFLTDPQATSGREQALQRGYRSTIALPLLDENKKTFGVFNIYSTEPNAFIPDEIRLLEELAGDLAFGIGVLRARLERARAERALQESEEKYRLLLETSTDIILTHDLGGNITYMNQSGQKVTEYNEIDIPRLNIPKLLPPEQQDALYRRAEARHRGELGTFEFETVFIAKSGKHVPIEVRSAPIIKEGHIVGILINARDITERKQADEALRASEARFRTLVDHAADAFFLHDEQGTILDVNRQACESLGYNREELIGQPAYAFDVGLDRAFIDKLEPQLAAGEGIEFNSWHRRKDGSLFPVEVRGRPFWQGERRFSVSLARDITERMRAQEALRESEERLRQIASSLREVVWLRDVQTRQVLYVNPAFQELTGRTCESFYKNRDVMIDAIHPDDKERVTKALEQRFERIPFDNEHRIIHLDGSVRWVASRIFPVRNETGEVYRWTSIMEDITERKQAVEALRTSEERYRALYHENPSMFFTLDTEGTIISVNDFGASQLGYTKDELKGQPVLSIFFDEDQAAVSELFKTCFLNLWQVYRWQFRKVRKDGSLMWVDEFARTVNGPDGAIYVLVVCQDISERKHVEEQVKKLNQELEQRVAERTFQLEAVNKELQAFAYSVSHDLRAPIRHIGGFLELLKTSTETTLDEQSLHYIDIVSDAAQRMGLMIDALLSFSRMSRSKMSEAEVDLEALVQDVIRDFQVEITGREVQWHISTFPKVVGDRTLLRMVFENLISNALKFTRSRTLAKVEMGWSAGPNNEIILFIRDNGVGFDMAYANKLFGVFQRLHRTDEFEGTGIGLANVRRIIERHGGKTWAEAQLGLGATFYFSLPQPEQKADD